MGCAGGEIKCSLGAAGLCFWGGGWGVSSIVLRRCELSLLFVINSLFKVFGLLAALTPPPSRWSCSPAPWGDRALCLIGVPACAAGVTARPGARGQPGQGSAGSKVSASPARAAALALAHACVHECVHACERQRVAVSACIYVLTCCCEHISLRVCVCVWIGVLL